MGLPAELFGGRGPTRWRKVSDTVAGFLRADGKLAPIYAEKGLFLLMKMPLLLISPKIGLKFLLLAKGGCFECYAIIGNKTEYYCVYIERLFAPFKG